MGSDGGFYQKSVQNPNGTLPAQQLLCIFFPFFFFYFLGQSWGLKQGVMLPPSSPGGPISGFLFPAGTRPGPSTQITSAPEGKSSKAAPSLAVKMCPCSSRLFLASSGAFRASLPRVLALESTRGAFSSSFPPGYLPGCHGVCTNSQAARDGPP